MARRTNRAARFPEDADVYRRVRARLDREIREALVLVVEGTSEQAQSVRAVTLDHLFDLQREVERRICACEYRSGSVRDGGVQGSTDAA